MAFSMQYIGAKDLVLTEQKLNLRTITLNRPEQLNALSYRMLLQLLEIYDSIEHDKNVKLVILKGNGRAFCAGGDIAAGINLVNYGYWGFAAQFYEKQLTLDYIIATLRKPQVSILDGIVMGGGAGISIQGLFRVATEKTEFAMPKTLIGLFPDVGASFFLSRLPGCFGEYCGLTGAKLNGKEMFACGLATHFVPSVIREGRQQSIKECLIREYRMVCHVWRGDISKDIFEGSRALLLDKDKKPQWEPSKLEIIGNELLHLYFNKVDDTEWKDLMLPKRSNIDMSTVVSKI